MIPSSPFFSSRSFTLAVPVFGRAVGIALALLGPIALGGCDRQSKQEAQPQASTPGEPLSGTIDRSHKGSAMPELSFKDAAGHELRLTSLKGKPLLVNLWATWCAPCVKEMPMLDGLAASGKVAVLTVSQDMLNPEKVTAFFAERKFARLQPWLDPQNDLAFHYGSGTLPTSVYYDAQGREVWRLVGGHDWAGGDTDALLAEAKAG